MKMIKQTLKDNNEGYILFENGDEWKKLFFNNGHVTGSSSSNKTDGLVQYLLYHGVINDSVLEKSFQTGFDTKNIVQDAIKSAHKDLLKQIVLEKIIDAVFISSRYPECIYSIVEEKSSEVHAVDIELSASDISNGLKKSIAEFEKMIEAVSKLGSRPGIDTNKSRGSKLTSNEELIISYLSSGKTIYETLSVMPQHNYFVFKYIHELITLGIITKGAGAPLTKEDIVNLVNESRKCKKCTMSITADFTLDALLEENTQTGKGTSKCKERISVFQKLHNEDHDNPLYTYCFTKAVSCFIIDFYKNKISPFATITINDNLKKLSNANQFDIRIYEIINNAGGTASIRNIIKSIPDRNEIDILVSIHKLLKKEVVKEIKPETFLDAVKMGKAEHFENLLKKEDLNRLFFTDISSDLTPYMLSVISGSNCEKIAEEIKTNSTYSRGKPVIHDYEMTYIMLASMTGNYEAAEYLLRNGADPDLHNGNGVTALMLALQNGHDDLAFLLMDYRADVNAKNGNGYSALMIAASKGMPHIVDNIIKHGADVNFLNSSKQSALNSAVRFGQKDVVISLVAAGSDINIRDIDGHTPLYYAESPEITELLQKGSRNSKLIKKELNKKRQNRINYKRNLLKDEKEVVPGSLPVFLFSTLFVLTSIINIHLIISSGDRFGLSSGSRKTMEQLGSEYCSKFKSCRKNVPKHVTEKCVEMGTDIMSEYFKFAKKCDTSLVEECKKCIRSISCEDFYHISGKNLSEYCYQCINICTYQM
jgi:ankyrin repeat protein